MDRIVRKIAGKAVSGCLLALSASVAYSGAMGPVAVPTVKPYIGVFGGGGGMTTNRISQFGTAFYTEADGGPLAVNAFGRSQSSSMGMVGGLVGFAWPNTIGNYWPVMPAAELEGYYIGGASVRGHDLSNDTVRLPEHDFLVNYPLSTGVFLVNAVLNGNDSVYSLFGFGLRPYVGVGIGTAVISISGASAVQLSPAEPGINHYNSDPNDKALAFAAQPKVGLRFDVSPHASVFAEYRYLYLSQTNYTFGSTVAPGHVATAPWLVSIKPQNYNMGTVGITFDV